MTNLDATGDVLQRAWRADLRRGRRNVRRLVVVAIAVLVIGASAAAASSLLKSPEQESASMVAGVTLFQGSHPSCVMTSPTSYRCTLASTATGETFGGNDPFLGMKMETVGADKRVDGGCVSVAADGKTWDCYVGQDAVDRGIIGPQLLGALSPEPAAG